MLNHIQPSRLTTRSILILNNSKTNLINCISYSSSVASLKTYNDIPGPKPYPLVGNLLELKNFGGEFDIFDYRKFQIDLQKKYGDIVKWNIGRNECFLYNPKDIKQVFKHDGNSPLRPKLDPLEEVFKILNVKATLVNSQGERWRRLRTAANPVMARPQTIYSYLPNHNEITNDFVHILNTKIGPNNSSIAIERFDEKLKLLALEYISEIAFDKRVKCMDTTDSETIKFVHSVSDFTVYAGRLIFQLPIWKLYRTKDWKKFEEASTFVYNKARMYIKEAQEENNAKKAKNETVKMTALSQFIENQNKYNIQLDEIVAIMTDLLLGGVDTTSTSMHYLLYELGTNLDIQDKLYQEIDSVLKPNESITEDHLAKLKYLKYTVKENFRIHPIVPGLARILHQDIIIDNYLIPKGTCVNFGTVYISQSDRFFKNPEKFDPSRWGRDEEGLEIIDPYASLAFGFGSRMCVGRRTAEQEIYITIAKLVQHFKIEHIGDAPKIKIGLIATPTMPLTLKLTKRNSTKI